MDSTVVYFQDEYGTQAKYKNIYFIHNEFCFLTTNIDIVMKPVFTHVKLTSKPFTFLPKLLYFKNDNDIQDFLSNYNPVKLQGSTIFVSGYYDLHTMHFITDTLYSTYVTFLKTDHEWNDKFNVLYDPPKEIGGISKFNYDIFQKFSKTNNFIFCDDIQNKSIVFDEIISGMHMHGLITMHKMGYLAEKDENTMQQYRDRFLEVYDIPKSKPSDKINAIIVHNPDIAPIIDQLLNYVHENFTNINCKIIRWDGMSWKQQIEITNNSHIYITGPGSAMNNFFLMPDNSIKICIGRIYNGVGGPYLPNDRVVYTNLNAHEFDCACRKYIYSDYFDLRKCQYHDMENICDIIKKNINSMVNNTIPIFKESVYITNWINYWKNEFKGNEKQVTKLFSELNHDCEKKNRVVQKEIHLWLDILEECKSHFNQYLAYE